MSSLPPSTPAVSSESTTRLSESVRVLDRTSEPHDGPVHMHTSKKPSLELPTRPLLASGTKNATPASIQRLRSDDTVEDSMSVLSSAGRSRISSAGSSATKDRRYCRQCQKTSPMDPKTMVDCSTCDRRYHRGCHNPIIGRDEADLHKWSCFICQRQRGKKRKRDSSDRGPLELSKVSKSFGDVATARPKDTINPSRATKSMTNLNEVLDSDGPFLHRSTITMRDDSEARNEEGISHSDVSIPDKGREVSNQGADNANFVNQNARRHLLASRNNNKTTSILDRRPNATLLDHDLVGRLIGTVLLHTDKPMTADEMCVWSSAHWPSLAKYTQNWKAAVRKWLAVKDLTRGPINCVNGAAKGAPDHKPLYIVRSGCHRDIRPWDPLLGLNIDDYTGHGSTPGNEQRTHVSKPAPQPRPLPAIPKAKAPKTTVDGTKDSPLVLQDSDSETAQPLQSQKRAATQASLGRPTGTQGGQKPQIARPRKPESARAMPSPRTPHQKSTHASGSAPIVPSMRIPCGNTKPASPSQKPVAATNSPIAAETIGNDTADPGLVQETSTATAAVRAGSETRRLAEAARKSAVELQQLNVPIARPDTLMQEPQVPSTKKHYDNASKKSQAREGRSESNKAGSSAFAEDSPTFATPEAPASGQPIRASKIARKSAPIRQRTEKVVLAPQSSQGLQTPSASASELDLKEDFLERLSERVRTENKDAVWKESLAPPCQDAQNQSGPTVEQIRSRPSRKQIFGKPAAASRLGPGAFSDRINAVHAALTNRGREGSRSSNPESTIMTVEDLEETQTFDNLDEVLDMPRACIPMIHEHQLVFGEPTTSSTGRRSRTGKKFKIGQAAKE